MDKIVIVPGIAMPFFPMRPAIGRVLRNKGNVQEFDRQVLQTDDWVVQPKLEGDRASIGVVDGKVYIQNRHGGWLKHKVENLELFSKLPDRTVLDGEVYKKNFYPFDCLAVDGRSKVTSTVMEREVLAFQMCKYVGVPWKFERPSEAWISKLREHTPVYGGVVLKRSMSPYIILGSDSTFSLDWLKRCWT
jgi:ATP-dependent DNA ligase